MDPLAAIKVTFFQECEEQLSELETGLLAMRDGEHDSETVNAVFRAVHSVKGGAGAFALTDLVRFAHVFETTLDEVRAGRLDPTAPMLDTMLRASDVLADLVRAARDGASVDEERSAALVQELEALSGAPGAAADGGSDFDGFDFEPIQFEPVAADAIEADAGCVVTFRPWASLYAKAGEPAILLREMRALDRAEIEIDCSTLPLLDALDPEGAYLAWRITTGTTDEASIREIFDFVDGDCDLTIERPGAADDIVFDDAPAELPPANDDAPSALPIDIKALIAMATADAQSTSAPAPAMIDPPLAKAPAAALETDKPAAAVAADADKSAKRGDGANAAGPATIRVDLDRVDRLIDLVGELVINQAMLAQRVLENGLARSSGIAVGLDDLELLTREIQDSVMAIRAQPVKSVFQRMPRLVREVAAVTRKQVRLVVEGEGTEVDKTVIERLSDPITHMIRNAIDHGLESTERRLEAGKPAEGTVRLSAQHRSGRIVIEVADDGGGIDRKRVRAMAIEKGLIAPDASLSDEDTDNIIFMPGFSTASSVSDISGRGVGMDVVRRSIQALGGRISITSRPGLGSTFTLSLPLTLAVLDGMVVSVCSQTFVLPISSIMETLQPKAGDLRSLAGSAPLLQSRGRFVPIIDVGRFLGYRTSDLHPSEGVIVLVEGDDGRSVALLVDSILGQRQVVIKSLEANYRQVRGIAAATILGDGRVALILDVDIIVTTPPPVDLDPIPEPLLAAG